MRLCNFDVAFLQLGADLFIGVLGGRGGVTQCFGLGLTIGADSAEPDRDLVLVFVDLPELRRVSADELKTTGHDLDLRKMQ